MRHVRREQLDQLFHTAVEYTSPKKTRSIRPRIELLITVLLVLCLSFLVSKASAQTTTTGTIEGIVTDHNGAVVPAVTVTVTSPNLIRAQSATTDREGRYRILNLPPGRYAVTAEATAGFARFVKADVDVGLSKTSSVIIQLTPAGATAIVNISGTSGWESNSSTSLRLRRPELTTNQ